MPAELPAPSPAALTADPATLWPQTKRLIRCSNWNRMKRLAQGEWRLDSENIEDEIEGVEVLIHGAIAQWHSATGDERRAALLQRWSVQITSLCAPYGEADDDALYRSARDAALLGPREARIEFLKAPRVIANTGSRLDLWGDWTDTATQLLDDMAEQGDAQALFLRGIALGFDRPPVDDGSDGMLDFLTSAIDNDPARAYRDLHAYLASGDTRWSAIAQTLLPQIGARVDTTQRAAIDAEFTKH